MGIKIIQATINGVTHDLTLIDGETNKYRATPTAPSGSSFNLEGGYYPVSIFIEDTAGNPATADHTHSTLGEKLKLYAYETHKPVITILSPTDGSYVTDTTRPVVRFKIVDNSVQESGFSGIDKKTVQLKVNGVLVDSSKIDWEDFADGSGCNGIYTPESNLTNGDYTVTVDCSDNDGNAAETATATFAIDTVKPTLIVSNPEDGFETNDSSIVVSGTTNDSSGKPVVIEITLNGIDQGDVTVNEDGTFNKTISFAEQGTQVIVITAIDVAGLRTPVTRTIVFNTTAPIIKDVTITPQRAECGTVYEIIVEVE